MFLYVFSCFCVFFLAFYSSFWGAESAFFIAAVAVWKAVLSVQEAVSERAEVAVFRSYSMLVQNGFIRFPAKGCSNIETQLTEFPLGAFDDLCDALWLAVQAAEKGGEKNQAICAINKSLVRTLAKGIIGKARRF